ncbi:uncharacterized protein LOC126581785 [Anopheles aquasalis]|uniref:uncharacterized protein LOC126581785 n=1 Tax=Anopheles aquasalis TaxID=42839 RepID=UPI00215AF7CC|nr:uncharacterized protein LOC126581785 [Anopheles aquasalis]
MGQLSKHFRQATIGKSCRDLLHPGQPCSAAWRTFVVQGVLGAFRHYLPAVVTPLLFRVRHWHEPEVWSTFVRQYCRCVLAGLPMTGGSFLAFCLFHKALGRFPPAWFVLVPSLAGGLTVRFLPRTIVRAQGIGLFNMYIEFLIRRSRMPTVAWMRSSKVVATGCFMAMSGGIMAAHQYLRLDRFWFARAYRGGADGHKEHTTPAACRQHVLAEVRKSFYVGLTVSVLKNVLPRLTLLLRSPLLFCRALVARFDYGLLSFITLYKALYEAGSCWLAYQHHRELRLSAIGRSAVAGIVAGVAYGCFPNYLLFTFPLTELVELGWLVYMGCGSLPKPSVVRWFDRCVPVAELLYTASLGLLCQLRVVHPYHVNRYWYKLMANGTWGRSDVLAQGYANVLLGC